MATRDLIGKRGEAIATARLMGFCGHPEPTLDVHPLGETCPILIDKRARALTMMLLTRREDLLVEEVTDDIGLEFIVRFHTKGKDRLRELGLQVTGVWAAVAKDEADAILRPAMQRRQRYGPYLRPVCLFLFAMENDGAWYTWVTEPIAAEDGTPRLRSRNEPDCRPLDKKAWKELIERVDVWYDALFPGLIVFPRRRVERGCKTNGKRVQSRARR